VPDASRTPLATLTGSGGALTGASRYIEVRADLTTTNGEKTPVINDLTVVYRQQ
jgi:hypothetical protein